MKVLWDTEYLGICMILPLSKSDNPEMVCINTRAGSVESASGSEVVLPFFSITQSIPSYSVILNNGRMTALAKFTHRHIHAFILSGLGNLDIHNNNVCWCKLKSKQTSSEMLYSPTKCWMTQYSFLKKLRGLLWLKLKPKTKLSLLLLNIYS